MPSDRPHGERAKLGRPSDMNKVVAIRTVTDDNGRNPRQVDVTVRDQLLETLRFSANVEHACARAGLAKVSFYKWLRTGARASRDLLSGARTTEDLDEFEAECLEFLHATDRADSEAKLLLLGPAHQLARGGQEVVTTTVRQYVKDGQQVQETTTRTERRQPDGAMLRWLLSKRFPAEFTDRVLVDGEVAVSGRIELAEAERAASLADSLEQWLEAQDAAAKAERARTRREHTNGN